MNRRQLLISMGAMVAGCGRTDRGEDTDGEWEDGTGGSSDGSDGPGLDGSGGCDSTGYNPARLGCIAFDSASVGPVPRAGSFGSASLAVTASTFCSAA